MTRADIAAAARLWGEALEADPKLAEDRQAQHRYNAACAAALAAAADRPRRGGREPAPDDAARAEAPRAGPRLAGGRAGGVGEGAGGPAGGRAGRRADPPALAGRRRPGRRARGRGAGGLPEAERAAWRALWDDVAALLQKAMATGAKAEAPASTGRADGPGLTGGAGIPLSPNDGCAPGQRQAGRGGFAGSFQSRPSGEAGGRGPHITRVTRASVRGGQSPDSEPFLGFLPGRPARPM